MKVLLFTPVIDNRSGKNKISSRIGLEATAISFDKDFNFLAYIKEYLTNNLINCILLDEGQFLEKQQVKQLSDITIEHNIPVLVYGLRSDFQGEPFEGSKYLLAWAENLIELRTICHCGKKATMNLRVDKNGQPVRIGEQIEIGGNERYLAVCRKHFNEGKYQNKIC